MSSPTGTVSPTGPANTANYDVSGAPLRYNPVRVNLQAVIDISGNVQIFTTPSTTIADVVICSSVLHPTALFDDASNSLFEFTEISGNRGDVSGYVSSSARNNGSILDGIGSSGLIPYLGLGLQGVLTPGNSQGYAFGTHSLDASGVNPFNKYKGLANNEYTTYTSLGELVLSLYAAYLFGHPAATAGITNDLALVNYINGITDGDADPPTVGADVGTNLATAVENLSNEVATSIVRAVLSQDPNRGVNAPNRQYNSAGGVNHMPLIFVAGDVVYVSITVQPPSVTTTGSGGAFASSTNGQSNLVGIAANAASNYPQTSPTIAFEITLGDANSAALL